VFFESFHAKSVWSNFTSTAKVYVIYVGEIEKAAFLNLSIHISELLSATVG
jgi:hypothetical protein